MIIDTCIPNWYVIQTKPRQEDRAYLNLSALGIETFLPKIRKRYKNKYKKFYTTPLFPSYLFANFNANKMLNTVYYTKGVQRVLCFGSKPCAVEVDTIDIIKSKIGDDGLIKLEKKLKPGDKVIIEKSYLKDLVGVLEKDMEGEERASVLLTTVSYQVHVIVSKDDLVKYEES